MKETDGEVPIDAKIWTTPKAGPMRAAVSVQGPEEDNVVQGLRSILQLFADEEEGEYL